MKVDVGSEVLESILSQLVEETREGGKERGGQELKYNGPENALTYRSRAGPHCQDFWPISATTRQLRVRRRESAAIPSGAICRRGAAL